MKLNIKYFILSALTLIIICVYIDYYRTGESMDTCLWIPHADNLQECIDSNGHVFGSVYPVSIYDTDFKAVITSAEFDDYKVLSQCDGNWNDDTSAMHCVENAMTKKRKQ